jgi:integrase
MRLPKICERKRPNGKITYFAQIGTKQVGLGADPKRAKKLFVELLVKKDDASSPDPLVRQVIDRFLSWCIRNQAPATYRWYAQFLKSEIAGKTSFWNFVTSGLRVGKLKRYDVTRWVDENYLNDSANYRCGAVRAVKRVFQWAVDEEIILYSPVAKIKLPATEHRELAIDVKTWGSLLALLENKAGKNYDDFRDLLTVIWDTGCRPIKARSVETRWFDRAFRRWVFPVQKSKGKKRQRVVYLTGTAFTICERLAAKYATGSMFRQQSGKEWTVNAIRCKFRRIQERLGIPDLCAYTLRHSWATRKLEAGVDNSAATG